MKVLIDGKEHNLSPDSNGLVTLTFTKQDNSPIKVGELENCSGITKIDNIQLEQNNVATAYEDPALIQGEATGLIKDIRGLEYAINDPVNGLRSQLTILAQGFEAEVADAIGNYSVQGQTIDGLFSEIKSIDGNLNQLIRNAEGNNQLISSIQNDVAQNRLDYHSLKETADSYERIIGSSQGEFESNVSRAVQTSGLIQQEVANLTSGLSTTVSQLEGSWALQLKDGNDLKTALNATTDGLRLKGDLIHLDGTTYVDGDFWAKEINSIQINADNIVGGQIDASKIRVVNLDVNSLTGNMSEFIQTNWNAINAYTQVDANGVQMLGSGTWRRTFLSPTGFRMFNGSGGSNKAGAIGYFKSSQDLEGLANPLNEDFMWQTQQRHAVGIGVNETHLLTLGYQLPEAGNVNGYNPALTIDPQKNGQVTISTGARFNSNLQVDGNLTLPGGDTFTTYNGLYLNTSYWTIQAKTGVRFFVGDQKKLHIGGNVELGTTLDMAGNVITGQSDYRLKKNIETLNTNDLDKLSGVRMVSYEWIDPERPKGTHVGFIAQELQEVYPEFITENDEGILSINNSELAMAHIHATQELNAKVDTHIFHVDNEVIDLKRQIKQLKDELAQLKGD